MQIVIVFSLPERGSLWILAFFCIQQAFCSITYWNKIRSDSYV